MTLLRSESDTPSRRILSHESLGHVSLIEKPGTSFKIRVSANKGALSTLLPQSRNRRLELQSQQGLADNKRLDNPLSQT